MSFEFPAFIKLEHRPDGAARASFLAEMAQITDGAEERFKQSFGEINQIVGRTLAGFSRNNVKLDIDVSALRQTSADAALAEQKLIAVRDAATTLATATGDTSQQTRAYLQALQAQTREAGAAREVADAQVTTYTRLQAEIDKTIAKNAELGASYRATFEEQARSVNAAHEAQQAVNAGYAPGLTRVVGRDVQSARDSASVFEDQRFKVGPTINTDFGAAALIKGKASIDAVALSATTLDQVLARVANKGPLVAAALKEAGDRAASIRAAADAEEAYARTLAATAQNLQFLTAIERADAESKAAQAAATNAAIAANNEFADAINRARAASAEEAAQIAASARSFAQLQAQLDPVVAADQRLAASIDVLDRAFATGQVTTAEYGRTLDLLAGRFAEEAEGARRGTTAHGAVTNSLSSMRYASIQAGQQMQDVAISLYSGQRASTVFAQQLPQLAFALSGLEGTGKKSLDTLGSLGRFLSGPWGLAVGLAVGALGLLTEGLISSGDETTKTERSQRSFTQVLNDSTSSWKEVTSAARDYADQIAKTNQVVLLEIQTEAAAIASRYKKAVATREALKAEQATDEQSLTSATTAGGIAGAATILATSGLSARQNENQTAIDALNRDAAALRVKTADAVAALADPQAKIKTGFDLLRDGARKTITDVAALSSRLADLNKQEKAALDGLKASSRSKVSGLFGRQIDEPQAEAIAKSAGFRVTSGLRTRAEQQHLYDTVRTPENPVALPGTSAHEKGKALDIAFGAGVTPASITKAFADEGVRLTKLLKETGHFHIEWSTSGADKAVHEADTIAKKQQELADFGARAADQIANINAQFDEQPKAVDQSAAAVRRLDEIITQLNEKKPPGFQDLVAQAQAAEEAAKNYVNVQIGKDVAATAQQLRQQDLLSQGLTEQAAEEQAIYEARQRYGNLLPDQVQAIKEMTDAEYQHGEALKKVQVIQSAYLDASQSARSAIEADLSGQGKLSDFKNIFKQLNAKVLTEQLFGGMFRDLDKWVQENTGLGHATSEFTDSTSKAGASLDSFTSEAEQMAQRLSAVSFSAGGTGASGAIGSSLNINPLGAPIDVSSALSQALGFTIPSIASGGGTITSAANDNGGDAITVVGHKLDSSVFGLTPDKFMSQLATGITSSITGPLGRLLGANLSGLSGPLAGGLAGYASGGLPGAVLGLAKGIDGLPKGISGALGKASAGAGTGTLVAGIGKALGIKGSTTGAQIGGAIGSFIPIPGGDIIGAIAGDLLGGLIKSTPRGSATISGSTITTKGNNDQYIAGSKSDAQSALSAVSRIADQFGASIDSAVGAVTIGIRDGKYRVDTTGTGITKTSKGAVDFGKDGEAAAIAYATADLIKDGVVKGLSQGVQNLIKSGTDLDTQIQKALDFQGVFDQLRSLEDPVGAAVDTLDKQFTHLKEIFAEASATTDDYAKLEKLYNIERTDAIKQAKQQIVGDLQSLLDSINGSSNLSLQDRETVAKAAYDPLADRVKAGDTTAYSDFASAANTLLDIEHQIYGSQAGYFAVANQIKSITSTAIDASNALADAAINSSTPFSSSTVPTTDNATVVSAINGQTTAIVQQLTASNDNLGAILQQLQASGTLASLRIANAF